MIRVFKPISHQLEADYLQECISTNWISSEGPFVKKFEDQFSTFVERKYGVAVNSGTSALELAVKSLNLKPGDEVILPSFTIIACLNAIYRNKLKPVLVDIDPETLNIDPQKIESKITSKTKAILLVHMYGLPCDLDPILDICQNHHLKIIEDAAEVHGQTYRDKKCGSFGDVSIFSFYANKILSTGEGGMVVTDNADIAEFCRNHRNQCFSPERRFVHCDIGHNFRMTNLQAAVGCAQLERIDETISLKRHIGKRYLKILSELPGVQFPKNKTNYAQSIFWVFAVLLPEFSETRVKDFCLDLKNEGVDTRPFFWPLHLQPAYLDRGYFKNESYPNSEQVSKIGFYLPSGPDISDTEIDKVCEAFSTLYLDYIKDD